MEQILVQTDIQCSRSLIWEMLKNTHEWPFIAPELFAMAPTWLDSGNLQISTKVTGSPRLLEVRVVSRSEDVLYWEAIDGSAARGSVETDALSPLLTRLSIAFCYRREGIMEGMYAKTGAVERRFASDLARIKRVLERQQSSQLP